MGELRQAQGRLVEAMEWVERAIAVAERLDAQVSISDGYQQLGELWALQGEWDRFEAAYTRAVEVVAGRPERRAAAIARYRRLRDAAAGGSQRA